MTTRARLPAETAALTPKSSTRRLRPAVAPDPVKITACSSFPPQQSRTTLRASERIRVIRPPQ